MWVPAVCSHPKELETCTRNRPAIPPPHWAHECKRGITRYVPPVEELYHPYVHANCVCNELVSATNRVLGDVTPPTPRGLRSLRRAARRMSSKLHPTTTLELEEVVRCFVGKRRTRYRNALQSFDTAPFCRKDARISAFVKAEKADPTAKVNPDPRMIQARNARYNILIAAYLKPMEHQLYQLRGGHTDSRLIAKGLNQQERARLLLSKMAAYSSPAVVSIDASRWDKHCSRQLIAIEHSVYLRLNPDRFFRQLLSLQLRNRCVTANGVRYSVEGNRMSGDMNTALGNCLLMCICLESALTNLNIRKWDILDDGDDCLIIVEQSELHKLDALGPEFLSYGHELKIENVATIPENVVFCQCHPVNTGRGWNMIRPWRKVLSCGTSGTQHWHNPSEVRPMCGLIGDCELALNAGIPILQEYAIALRRISMGKRPKTVQADDGIIVRACKELGTNVEHLTTRLHKIHPKRVTDEARLSFELAYGVTVDRQLDIERVLRGWDISVESAVPVPSELDHHWVHELDPSLHGRETY